MIVRIWHGRTRRERADEYGAFLTMCAIPDYHALAGICPEDKGFLLDFEPEVQHYSVVVRASGDA